jgi:hypothetical protein
MGPALGNGRGEGVARHAGECRHRPAVFRDQRPDPLGRGDRVRFPRPDLAHLPPGAGLGGNVRKGEHGTTVVYADRFTPEDEKRRARETGEEAAAIPFLKRFTVFNAAQCENLPAEVAAIAPSPPPA